VNTLELTNAELSLRDEATRKAVQTTGRRSNTVRARPMRGPDGKLYEFRIYEGLTSQIATIPVLPDGTLGPVKEL
jgi:hypothetical protein